MTRVSTNAEFEKYFGALHFFFSILTSFRTPAVFPPLSLDVVVHEIPIIYIASVNVNVDR